MSQLDEGQALANDQVETEVVAGADMYPDDTADADDTEQEAEPQGDATEQQQDEEPEQPAINAPHSWKAEHKEACASLPRKTQEDLSQRETEQTKFLNQKAQEAAQARHSAQEEAMQHVAQLKRAQAQQLQTYADQMTVNPPDPSLLSEGPEGQQRFYQQDAVYRHWTAQREGAQREAAEAQRQAEAIETQQLEAFKAQEREALQSQLPAFYDPSEGPKLQQELSAIAQALNYPPELMAEANATDILALNTAAQWKRDSEELAALKAARAKPVQQARHPQRQMQPRTPQGQFAPQDAAALLYPDDIRK